MATINFISNVGQSVSFDPTADLLSIGYPASDVRLVQNGSNVEVTVTNVGTVTLLSTTLGNLVGEGGIDSTNIAVTEGRIYVGDGENSDTDSGSDDIDAGTTSDIIYGLGGGDDISTNTGNDIVFGGSGITDTADGGDAIEVGVAKNNGDSVTVYANAGDDTITVNTIDEGETVTIFAGLGDDTVDGVADAPDASNTAEGNIVVNLAAGDDEITFSETLEGTASIVGGSGEDVINMTNVTGDTTVYGGSGTTDSTDGGDTITTGAATSTVYGNAGNDSITVAAAGSSNTVFVNAGIGNDTITATANDTDATLQGGWGDDTITDTTATAGESLVIYGGNSLTDTNDGDDTIRFNSAGTAAVYGNAGNDTITADDLGDSTTINGGLGDDEIIITTVSAASKEATITGAAGSDEFDITMGNFDSTITITDFSADEDLTLNFGSGAAATAVTVSLTGNQITLEDDANNGATLVIDNYAGSLNSDNFTFSGTGDLLVNQNTAASLNGGTAADYIVSGSAGDTIDGGDGQDKMEGNAGDDVFLVADADLGDSDTIDGGVGADTIRFTDVVTSLVDADFTNVSNVETLAFTATGANTGNVIGAQFNDSDIEVIDATALDDSGDSTGIANGDAITSDVTFNGSAGVDTINFDNTTGSTGNFTINGNAGDDVLTGGDAADTIDGGADDDNINGADGNDSIIGGEGDDTITGGAGNDTIDAGAGDDTIDGSAGSNVYTGGAGDDTYRYDDGAEITAQGTFTGFDTITDFANNDDTFSFDANAGFEGGADVIGDGNTTLVSVSADAEESDGTAVLVGTTDLLFIENVGASFDFDDVNDVTSYLNNEDDIALDEANSGDSLIILLSNGTQTGVYLHTMGVDDDTFAANELSMVALVTGTVDAGDVTLF